jgi:tetratricopeptide (TPR) repeat protein
MKKISLILLLTFLAPFFIVTLCLRGSFAQEATGKTPGAIFYQANIYYQEGKFEAAIKSYEKIIDLGLESGNIYYNLGNSYFKKGELGLAVLNYERARVFMPNDSDLRSNYDYALQRLNLEPQLFGNWFERTVYALFQAQSIDSLAILLFFIYIVLTALFILNLFISRLKRFCGFMACVLIILFILSAFGLNNKINYLNKTAIVVSQEADVKFEPLENATTYFKLSEGSKVEVVEKTEDWYKVRRFDTKLGWVSRGVLRQILIK